MVSFARSALGITMRILVTIGVPAAALEATYYAVTSAQGSHALDGDFFAFMAAMALAMLLTAVWAGLDGRRMTPASTAVHTWVAVPVISGVLLGIGGTLLAPGSPERVAEAVSSSLFYTVPLVLAALLGLGVGMSSRPREGLAGTGLHNSA